MTFVNKVAKTVETTRARVLKRKNDFCNGFARSAQKRELFNFSDFFPIIGHFFNEIS